MKLSTEPGVSRTTVRAAVLGEAPGPLRIEEVLLDDWLAPDEVRVQVHSCGLCHSDLHMLDGEMPIALPSIPGHEIAGTVEAVGENVTSVAVGDRVVACLSVFCGVCAECRTGRSWLCVRRNDLGRDSRPAPRLVRPDGTQVHQAAGMGGFAERTILQQNNLVKVSEDLPADRAGLLGCAVLTGVGSVLNGAKVRAGETVAVIGCGGVGLNVIQGARLTSASKIIAIDVNQDNLDLAEQFGATHTIDASAGDPIALVTEVVPGGVDHVFDVVGRAPTVAQAVAMVRQGRTAWILGIAPIGEMLNIPAMPLVVANKGVQGLLMGANHFPRDIPMLADLYLAGLLDLDTLVTGTIELDQVNDGFDQMRQGGAGRLVATM
ncbi:Zn-dependent alcohol dehydrogenase [Enemella sp. A6]|uniref:Zn-dependent alcohol dehydrogenase n=1 Tax=Enemella sp. A6 TaxID=3440152 RepID=UPI003EB73B5E